MKQTFLVIFIAVLVVVIFLQRIFPPKQQDTKPRIDTLVVHDTTYVIKDSIIRSKPRLVKVIMPPVIDIRYKPDTNYIDLKLQYENLVLEHTAKKIYSDSIHVDSLGYINVSDTVQYNSLSKRYLKYDFKIPRITETITITKQSPPTRQLYLGGSISTNRFYNAYLAQVGLLYKTKSDKLFGPIMSFNTNGDVMFGFQMYWKIKLK